MYLDYIVAAVVVVVAVQEVVAQNNQVGAEMELDKLEIKVVQMLLVADVQWRYTGSLVVVMNEFDVH